MSLIGMQLQYQAMQKVRDSPRNFNKILRVG